MTEVTEAELAGQVKRLQKSLDHATTKIATLDKSLARAKAKNRTLTKTIAVRNAELTESLEQQTATSEILRIISRSPTDAQPVFDAIVKSGSRLLGDQRVVLRLVKGNQTVNVARSSGNVGDDLNATSLADEGRPDVRAILRREVVDVPDFFHADSWVSEFSKSRAAHLGRRANTHAPLLLRDKAIGAIAVDRANPGALTSKQIALLKTFADQAVIAIENTRLFNETKEALERQTATAEILRVISGSPTDLQPVFDAILGNALRLCDAHMGHLGLYDGEMYQYVAQRGANAEYARFLRERGRYRPLGPLGRMVAERQHVHVADARDAPEYRDGRPGVVAMVELGAGRTFLAVPMLNEGRVVGGISIYRPEVRPFTQKQIELVTMFADQAVIAIQNVRLFKELEARNAEVTEALEQQTATSEILRIISSSPTDTQPIFDAIVRIGARLFQDGYMSLRLVKGDRVRMVASTNKVLSEDNTINDDQWPSNWSLMRKEVIQVPNIFADDPALRSYRERQEKRGVRASLFVPLLRDDEGIGVLSISRPMSGAFTDKQVALLRTFADQAVIAIENARLFNEIQEKSRQLQIANQHKSEFLANMSHELRTPLNAVIGFSEVLQQGMVGELNDKQGEYIEYIHKSGSHLLSLINDILDLSKVEAGRMELDLKSFNVPMAIDNALTLVKERATRHGLTLDCTLDPAVAEINADERKFKQVMLNLLSNAVKFTPEGGRITVAARPVTDAVEVSVTDTGIGIAPEDCDAVFEEFRQVGDSVEGKAQGTGLGLALTKKFIELHGGRIWLSSTLGKGSTFFFTLPVTQPAEAVAQAEPTN